MSPTDKDQIIAELREKLAQMGKTVVTRDRHKQATYMRKYRKAKKEEF